MKEKNQTFKKDKIISQYRKLLIHMPIDGSVRSFKLVYLIEFISTTRFFEGIETSFYSLPSTR